MASDTQNKYIIDGVEVDAVKTGYVNSNGNPSYFNNYDSGSKYGGYNCNFYWEGNWNKDAQCVLSSQDHVIGASRINSEGYVRVKVPQRGRIYVKVGYDVDCAAANNSEIQVFFTDKNGNKITSAGNLKRTFSWRVEVPRNADGTVNSTAEWKNTADITSNVKIDKDSYIYIFLKHGGAGEECSAYGYVKQISIIN